MSLPMDPSKSTNFDHACKWAKATVEAAREWYLESLLYNRKAGEYANLRNRIPYNPWFTDKKILLLNGSITSLKQVNERTHPLKNLFSSDNENLPPWVHKLSNGDVVHQKSDTNASTFTSTANDSKNTVNIRNSNHRDEMTESLKVLRQLKIDVSQLEARVKSLATEATDTFQKVKDAAKFVIDKSTEIELQLNIVQSQQVDYDSKMCELYYAEMTAEVFAGDGHHQVRLYLMAQDLFREENCLLTQGSECDIIIQNIFLFFESIAVEPKEFDKNKTRQFLKDRCSVLSPNDVNSAKLKKLYQMMLSFNTTLFFRIIGMDVDVLTYFIGHQGRKHPSPFQIELFYYRLVCQV